MNLDLPLLCNAAQLVFINSSPLDPGNSHAFLRCDARGI